MKHYLHLALRYFGFAGLWAGERIKMKEMKIPLLLFMIATTILLSLHFWYNWDNYFFTPEDEGFHPNEPAGEWVEPEAIQESAIPLPTQVWESK